MAEENTNPVEKQEKDYNEVLDYIGLYDQAENGDDKAELQKAITDILDQYPDGVLLTWHETNNQDATLEKKLRERNLLPAAGTAEDDPILKEGIDEQWLSTLTDNALAELKAGNFDAAMKCLAQAPQMLSYSQTKDSTLAVQMFKHAGLTREQLDEILNNDDLQKVLLHDQDPEEFRAKIRESFDTLPAVSVQDALAEVTPTADPVEEVIEEVTPEEETAPTIQKAPKKEKQDDPKPEKSGAMEIEGGEGEGNDFPEMQGYFGPKLLPLENAIYDSADEWFKINIARASTSMLQPEMANKTEQEGPIHFIGIGMDKDHPLDLTSILANKEDRQKLYDAIAKQLSVSVDNIFIGPSIDQNNSLHGFNILLNSFAFKEDGHFDKKLQTPIGLDLKTILTDKESDFGIDQEAIEKLPKNIQFEYKENLNDTQKDKNGNLLSYGYSDSLIIDGISLVFQNDFKDSTAVARSICQFTNKNVQFLKNETDDSDHPEYYFKWEVGQYNQSSNEFVRESEMTAKRDIFSASQTTDLSAIQLVRLAEGKKDKWECFSIDRKQQTSNADFLKTCAAFAAAGLQIDDATNTRLKDLLADANHKKLFGQERSQFVEIFKPQQSPGTNPGGPGVAA